jgi:hypothetical protein
MPIMLLDLLPYVDTGEPIPVELMLKAVHEAEDGIGEPNHRQLANNIMGGAGDYLLGYLLVAFIRAGLSDRDAHRLISERKSYIERARNLFPSILNLFGARNYESIRLALLEIGDCCHDFPIIEKSNHSKKQRKEICKKIDMLRNALKGTISCIEQSSHNVHIEFEHHKTALLRTDVSEYLPLRTLDQVKNELKHLTFAADIVAYREKIGDEHFIVGDNKARTHIVKCAYSLALYFGKPQFVTTPGSDFAFLCGLIFELATGISDESLAGAINKFARSELRKELDRNEVELRKENSAEGIRDYEADNFAGVRERIAQLLEEYEFWKDMAASRHWEEFQTTQLNLRTLDVLEQIEKATQEYGPHLVWASQISERDRERSWRENGRDLRAFA